jgi:hypothetical protein
VALSSSSAQQVIPVRRWKWSDGKIPPVAGFQLVYWGENATHKWLNSMVYDRYNLI